MFALLILGGVLILLNYLELLPGATSNWYLFGGLGLHPRRHPHRHAVPLTPADLGVAPGS